MTRNATTTSVAKTKELPCVCSDTQIVMGGCACGHDWPRGPLRWFVYRMAKKEAAA